MEYLNFTKNIIENSRDIELKKVDRFLKLQGLIFDFHVDYTTVLYDAGRIIATGSFKKNILKCIAVSEEYKGLNLTNKIVSELINEQFRRGYSHLFIYTKPKNTEVFKSLGFYEVERAMDKVVLFENIKNGIKKYCEKLIKESSKNKGKNIAAIVANCNPFTLGHKYLIENAAKENDLVHVFVLWEDESIFSNEDRYRLVEEGTSHLKNVLIHKAEDYIISNATFPSYFLKKSSDAVTLHALLDINIFSTYIAKALNIKRRYIGQEPFCEVTKEYNNIMKEVLPFNGIEVIEIPRLSINGEVVSATKVRTLLKQGSLKEIKKLVPPSTYSFLVSNFLKRKCV
ncbi:[citrate (pro-3S)-lyase] ligase [Clostridium tarantellae]|uniref:[Citrate [pro-3S]-lyase] ligase n=1 Tax=Clostridium tarantellae TaxID=39493 RepID=A0A6I1MSF8_9CLOT|nr:[citrate (pro-3S)-lyase] ligase [Clostridium tarantellae]MPQ43821.1 [citrate (pro-3S)-lyase] ligase [Clostridium tarantellae]